MGYVHFSLMVNRWSLINGLRKLRNPSSGLLIIVVIRFDKIPVWSKDLITFIISFISLLVSVFLEPFNNGKGFILNLLLTGFDPASKRAFGILLTLTILSPVVGISMEVLIIGTIKLFIIRRNPHDCAILGSCTFDNFLLANKPFSKSLQIRATCVLVNNGGRLRVTRVPSSIPSFTLLSCELDKFIFKASY